jgi:hypothetical protein
LDVKEKQRKQAAVYKLGDGGDLERRAREDDERAARRQRLLAEEEE